MYDLKPDTDLPLVNFVNDYVEDRLDEVERSVFLEYLSTDVELALFVAKSKKGKRALRNASRKYAAPDFEEKLALRIAEEKEMENSAN